VDSSIKISVNLKRGIYFRSYGGVIALRARSYIGSYGGVKKGVKEVK
jgi:hypothetical protein